MSDVFAEVQEAIKQEKLENFFKNYGGYVLAFALALVLGTAANAGYRAWKEDTTREQTAKLAPVLLANDPVELEKMAEDMTAGLDVIAMLQAAGVYLQQGKPAEALKIYAALASKRGVDDAYKQLAAFMVIRLDPSVPAQAKLEKLHKISGDEKNPWRNHARLSAALILAHDLGQYADARTYLADLIQRSDVPDTLKQKATSLDVLYALKAQVEGKDQPEQNKDQSGQTAVQTQGQ